MTVSSEHLPSAGAVPGSRAPGRSLGRVAWVPDAELEFADWIAAGRRLGAVGRGYQWWIGDWIRYGKTRFGERYVQASKVTGYDNQTLMNMVYVASRFEISRRREDLSWSHHETVAALAPIEQDRWLARAAEERMTVSDLRLELRTMQRRGEGGDGEEGELEPSPGPGGEVIVCPNCGHQIDDSKREHKSTPRRSI